MRLMEGFLETAINAATQSRIQLARLSKLIQSVSIPRTEKPLSGDAVFLDQPSSESGDYDTSQTVIQDESWGESVTRSGAVMRSTEGS